MLLAVLALDWAVAVLLLALLAPLCAVAAALLALAWWFTGGRQ